MHLRRYKQYNEIDCVAGGRTETGALMQNAIEGKAQPRIVTICIIRVNDNQKRGTY